MLEESFWFFFVAGVAAQLVDGTLSMAYGVTASSLLAVFGVPPAATSASVHAAETITTGFASLSHHYFRNVDWRLVRRLAVPGVIGAVLGAYGLSTLPGAEVRPYVSAYLFLMGLIICVKAFRTFPPAEVTRHLFPLGLVGAFLDAVGGGGWGPIVASTLIVRGHEARRTIGSVAAAEFFVTLAASLTFLFTIGVGLWIAVLGLALGGACAAPIGAWACRHLPIRPLMVLVGLIVMALSLRVIVPALF
jgi:uncharacterized membrane protein YfcA